MTFDPKSVRVTCVTLPKDHCVQVPWKYIKVCGYSDPFSKTWTKGHWPLDDLWPHICWGHMCDSTQGSLCPSPMEIHQCMWIKWSILQNTTYYRTCYGLRTEWVITFVSFWTQFRRDKNLTNLSRPAPFNLPNSFGNVTKCVDGSSSDGFLVSFEEF